MIEAVIEERDEVRMPDLAERRELAAEARARGVVEIARRAEQLHRDEAGGPRAR